MAQVRGGGLEGDGVAEAAGGGEGGVGVGGGEAAADGDAVAGQEGGGGIVVQGDPVVAGVRQQAGDVVAGGALLGVLEVGDLAGGGGLAPPPGVRARLGQGAYGPFGGGVGGDAAGAEPVAHAVQGEVDEQDGLSRLPGRRGRLAQRLREQRVVAGLGVGGVLGADAGDGGDDDGVAGVVGEGGGERVAEVAGCGGGGEVQGAAGASPAVRQAS